MQKAIVTEIRKLDKLNIKLTESRMALGAAQRKHNQTSSMLEATKMEETAAEHLVEAAECALYVTVRKVLADETSKTGGAKKASSGKTLDPRIVSALKRQEKVYNRNGEELGDRLYDANEKHRTSTAALSKAVTTVASLEDEIQQQTQTLSIVVRNMYVENGGQL